MKWSINWKVAKIMEVWNHCVLIPQMSNPWLLPVVLMESERPGTVRLGSSLPFAKELFFPLGENKFQDLLIHRISDSSEFFSLMHSVNSRTFYRPLKQWPHLGHLHWRLITRFYLLSLESLQFVGWGRKGSTDPFSWFLGVKRVMYILKYFIFSIFYFF